MSKLLSMFEGMDPADFEHKGGPTTELSCDVVIVGGGGSGLVSAVRATQLGKKVIVIEKMNVLGGNSWYAGGLLTTYSKFQEKLGMPDKTHEYYKKAYQQCGYTLNDRIFRRYIKNTGTFFEWIAELGLDSENIRYMWDSVAMVNERLEPGPLNNPKYGPGLMGSNILSVLYKKIDELGIQILKETKVNSLLTSDDGGVIGITADGMDKSYTIHASSVILSSGGFGGNTELLKRFLPQYFSSDNYISHYCRLATTGEGILMAEKIGAEVGKNISVGIAALCHIPGSYSIQTVVNNEKCIIVNKQGQRFIAEDDRDDAEFAVDLQEDGMAYAIFDATLRREMEEDLTKPNFFGDRNPTPEELNDDLIRENSEAKLCIANSLIEAATFIGTSESALKESIDKYNQYVDDGEDGDFFKGAEFLQKIEEFPLYIIKMQRNFDVTMGGVSINEHLQALDINQKPIRGLYVTGDAASNWMGPSYGPLFSSFAWAMNSGYIAGEEVANN